MLVMSVRVKRLRIAIIAVMCLIIILLIISAIAKAKALNVNANTGVQKLDNNSQRIEFLQSYGWKVSDEPVEVKDILIPSEFNDTYTQYNEIQKGQGFNLTNYKGQVCKLYTYKVENYKGDSKHVEANLMVYDGALIGGDISNTEENGFIKGFSGE